MKTMQLPTKTKPQNDRDNIRGVSSKVQTNSKEEFLYILNVLWHHYELENLVKTVEDK